MRYSLALPRSRIKNSSLCQKEGFHHSVTMYDEVVGQNAKTDFRFLWLNSFRATAGCVIPWPLLFVRQQQTIDLAN